MSQIKQIKQILTSKKLLKNVAYYVIVYNYPIVGISYNLFKLVF
jgi:hypothetical protein